MPGAAANVLSRPEDDRHLAKVRSLAAADRLATAMACFARTVDDEDLRDVRDDPSHHPEDECLSVTSDGVPNTAFRQAFDPPRLTSSGAYRGGKRLRCCSPGGRPGRERLPRDLRGGHANPATGQVRAPSRSVPRRCARHLARRRGRGGRLPAASLGGKDVGDGRGGAWDTGSNTVVCEGAGREGCAARMTGGARGGTCAATRRSSRPRRRAGRRAQSG